jgi:hypothetical protein
MRVTHHFFIVGVLALGAAACTGDDGGRGGGDDVDAGTGGVDTGMPPADDGGGASLCTIPAEPYGASLGRKLRPFELQRCDGSLYAFYNDAWCDPATGDGARFTAINIAAGWCGPCRMEASQIRSRILDPYGPQGVRFMQVLIQDNDYGPPDLAFCNDWVSDYGLEDAIELIDPEQRTQPYFPGGSLPSLIIVDADGVIQYRENGASQNLSSLTSALDRLLAE